MLQVEALKRLNVDPKDAVARKHFRTLSLIYGSPEQAELHIDKVQSHGSTNVQATPFGVAVASTCPPVLVTTFPREASICFRPYAHRSICFAFLDGSDLPKFAARVEQLLEESRAELQAALSQVKTIIDSAMLSRDCLILRHML